MSRGLLSVQGEDGYLISEVVEPPGCHTQAKTLDELMKRTREAIYFYLKCKKGITKEKFLGIQNQNTIAFNFDKLSPECHFFKPV